MDNTQQIFPAFRLVAQFADGQRLTIYSMAAPVPLLPPMISPSAII